MIPTETIELIAAFRAVALRHKANLSDDGVESGWEKLGYIKELRTIRRGLDGIKAIPLELINIKSDDVPELADAVSMTLNVWGVNHRRQDITAEIIRDIVDSIPVFKEAKNRWEILMGFPPTAELVE